MVRDDDIDDIGDIGGTPTGREPRVTLLTRTGCHLCDDARAVVTEVVRRTGTTWHEVDVDTDAELAHRYSEQVPVVLVDGVRHAYWRVDASRLEGALRHGGGWRGRWLGQR